MSVPTTFDQNRSTSKARSVSPTVFAVGGLVVASVIIVVGNVGLQPGEHGGTGPAVFTGVLCLLVTVGLFAGLLPRLGSAERASRVAVVLGALGVASLGVFWSGLPPVLAAAAAAVTVRLDRPSRAARVLTVLAAVAALLAAGVTLAA